MLTLVLSPDVEDLCPDAEDLCPDAEVLCPDAQVLDVVFIFGSGTSDMSDSQIGRAGPGIH